MAVLPRYERSNRDYTIDTLLSLAGIAYERGGAADYDAYRQQLMDRWQEVTDEQWTALMARLALADGADDARGWKSPWQPYPPSPRVARTLARWSKRSEVADA